LFIKIVNIPHKGLDKCCGTPVGDLATADILSACNTKNNKQLNSWINDYVLNKLQIAKLGNAIDITNKNIGKILFLNCVFHLNSQLKSS
jgi:hypothetical protein